MKLYAYDSIQDFLIAKGFSIDQEQGHFSKWNSGWQFVTIPFVELAGHSVPTFAEKAFNRGWLSTETATSSAQEEQLFPCV
jgi:hypothetical protein